MKQPRIWFCLETWPSYSAWRVLAAASALSLGTICWGQAVDLSRTQAEAAKAEAAGHTSQALDLYAKQLASTPEWTEGWWKYGGLLYQERRFHEAALAFGRLTRLAPANDLGYALLGLCEYEEADWSNAVLHLDKAVNRGGLPPDIFEAAAYHLGLSLMRQGNQGGAMLALRGLFHKAPDYPGLRLALGAAELNLKEPPVPTAPEFPPAQIAASAAVAVLEVRSDDAEKSYRELVAQFPNVPSAHLAFGLFLESHHRDDEAIKEFTAEAQVSPTSAVPWLWLARVALVQENSDAALSYVAKARELVPNDPLSFLIEGRSLMAQHRWEQALSPLRKAEDLAPQSSEVHFALASVYTQLHRPGEADKERQLFLAAQAKTAAGEDAQQ
jgi:tetratricopeptide (TPR) repeat protein